MKGGMIPKSEVERLRQIKNAARKKEDEEDDDVDDDDKDPGGGKGPEETSNAKPRGVSSFLRRTNQNPARGKVYANADEAAPATPKDLGRELTKKKFSVVGEDETEEDERRDSRASRSSADTDASDTFEPSKGPATNSKNSGDDDDENEEVTEDTLTPLFPPKKMSGPTERKNSRKASVMLAQRRSSVIEATYETLDTSLRAKRSGGVVGKVSLAMQGIWEGFFDSGFRCVQPHAWPLHCLL